MSAVIVTGWYLEYREGTSNKFYTVLIADNGVVVTQWGRIGSQGQNSVKKMPTKSDAEDIGKRQLYAKKSKGYSALAEDVTFTMEDADLIAACEQGDPYKMTRAFAEARTAPQFDGDKKAVSAHYDDFVEKAQTLMATASDQPFDVVMAQFEELQSAWTAISDKHDEAAVTISLTSQMLNQRLMSGSL